jgi:hypothetical protein
MKNLQLRCAAVSLAIAGCALTGPASAQAAPSFATPLGDERLGGVVVRFTQGSYELGLRDDNGFVDNVRLHDRTIILPIGLTLRPGMRVRIVGFTQGNAFTANEIDVPPPVRTPLTRQPQWYAEWDGAAHPAGSRYLNAPAPVVVNPPAPP